ncbi:pantoate--beta-alanine ligase [Alpinimonas psychrophila]|uniref:Pantothenate synthetase n=1 Tax=Alpinimonas psychrophila TaxID=748908 RepID=A0A7W3PPD1_9MICO|nr:pantoate--beta-alanine ligase [Alpinimonas psychrophila]MBA8829789.1 pantoate--beta-alanine ligase [Alpinimonas psychrophila]
MSGAPKVLTTVREAGQIRHAHDGHRIALVPTMGALHEGHLELIRHARTLAEVVLVSIFVNPLQFGVGEDFDRYPRTLEVDVAALADEGVDYVFAPSTSEMYPAGLTIPARHAGPVGTTFEGAARPTHFDGMLTVVARLFDIVGPNVAVFGQKDAQQVFLVRQMIAQNDWPIELDVVRTVREHDGLALSSRNRFLDESQRGLALVMPEALTAIALNAPLGVAAARTAGRQVFAAAPLARLDYLDLVDPKTFTAVSDDYQGPVTAVIAAVIGSTRLIDTDNLVLGSPEADS